MIGPQTSIYSQYLLRTVGGSAIPGLDSYWLLNEPSGIRLDSVGGNDLTDNNTVGYELLGPPNGLAANFVGASTDTLSNTDALDGVGEFTVALWLKVAVLPSGLDSGVIGKDEAGDRGWQIILSGGHTPVMWGTFSNVSSGVQINDNAWHLVTGTLSVAGNEKTLRVDKNTPGTNTLSGFSAPSVASLTLGNWFAGTYLTAQIGPTGLWSRVLSLSERDALLRNGIAPKYADLTVAEKVGLISYYNMDEASGSRVDSHGSNTLTDNSSVGSATNSFPANMPGTAANFVAANAEYLSHVDTPSLRIGTSVAIAYWLKPNGVGQTAAHVSKAEGSGVNRDYLALTIAGAQAFSGEGSNVDLVTDGTPADGVWTFVYVEKDATSGKCGVSLNNGVLVQSAGSSAATPTDAPFAIGARSSFGGGIDLYYTGQLSGVGLWHRILTTDERTLLYAAGAGLFYPF